MPPNQSRSTGALRIALIRLAGSSALASMPSASRASALSGIDFSVRGKTPPPFEISFSIVIVPARARQLEQALALVPARRRIGIGIDEDVAVVEGGDAA